MATAAGSLLISSLVEYGKRLSSLLREAKTGKVDLDKIRADIEEAAAQASNFVEKAKASQLPDSFSESDVIIAKLTQKIKTTRDKLDKPSLHAHPSTLWPNQRERKQGPTPPVDDGHRPQIDDRPELPDPKERDCLSFCCALLSFYNDHNHNDRDHVGISKRELIHWWIGLNLIDNPNRGEQLLDKLLETKLITPTSSWAFACMARGYKVHASILSNAEKHKYHIRSITSETQRGSATVLCIDEQRTDGGEPDIVGAINRDVSTVDTFDAFLAKNTKVNILHLGRWPYTPKNNFVVEEIDALKSFITRSCQSLTILSLQGVGGIVELPDSVYSIRNVKVLNLKACPNLETLPPGISVLTKLTSLDVSNCYLLSHIPKGIGSLTELRVLKGFIINPENHSDEECEFEELERLTNLIKLTIRARNTSFPTKQHLNTLSKMQGLTKLKVTWVQQSTSSDDSTKNDDGVLSSLDDPVPLLPRTLRKLELVAASETTASRVLDLISNTSGNCPKKLYIRGGGLRKLDPYVCCFPNVEELRLRHLRQLYLKWIDCQLLFPKLSQLDVFRCPNLIFFPCTKNGLWSRSEQS